jgi:transposase
LTAGYEGAKSIFEMGPGRNIATGLLWWAVETGRAVGGAPVRVVLWDVFKNARVESDTWRRCASQLLNAMPYTGGQGGQQLRAVLEHVAAGSVIPDIAYTVVPLAELDRVCGKQSFELVYSHAAIEHAWNIRETWEALFRVTAANGWHSHRIDLADHGGREGNYIEMLEWSSFGYWLTMRYVPGAINRWRAADHLQWLQAMGLKILSQSREVRDSLPVPRARLSRQFRDLDEVELRTTAIDLVAQMSQG